MMKKRYCMLHCIDEHYGYEVGKNMVKMCCIIRRVVKVKVWSDYPKIMQIQLTAPTTSYANNYRVF